jgi:hypothetical protein
MIRGLTVMALAASVLMISAPASAGALPPSPLAVEPQERVATAPECRARKKRAPRPKTQNKSEKKPRQSTER